MYQKLLEKTSEFHKKCTVPAGLSIKSNTSLSGQAARFQCVIKKRNQGEGQLFPLLQIAFALETKYGEILTVQFISKRYCRNRGIARPDQIIDMSGPVACPHIWMTPAVSQESVKVWTIIYVYYIFYKCCWSQDLD